MSSFRHLDDDEVRPMPRFYLRAGASIDRYSLDGETVTIDPPFVAPADGLYEVSVWDGQVFRGPLPVAPRRSASGTSSSQPS